MASPVRFLALALVLAVVAPALAPFVQGSSGNDDGCACQTRCCRTSERPVRDASPCHGARRDTPSCSLRCNHAGTPAPLMSLVAFLPEGDTSVVALLPRADAPRPFRPTTQTGFDRIDSPPPRLLVLAI